MSRATTKPAKLPAGLPALPPVPAGYSRWEYKGKGWTSDGAVVGAPWSCASRGDKAFVIFPQSWKAFGFADGFYIVAVRDPKPAAKPSKVKSARKCECSLTTRALGDGCDVCNPELAAEIAAENAKPKPARKGRVVAKLEKRSADTGRGYYADSDRFVLPADAASVERMVEEVTTKLMEFQNVHAVKPAAMRSIRPLFRKDALEILACFGIRAAKKGGRK